MQSIPTRKYFAAIRFSEKGQGFLEYVLVLAVVLGVVFVAAKPVIEKIKKNMADTMKAGVFQNDPTGSNFYYFPMK